MSAPVPPPSAPPAPTTTASPALRVRELPPGASLKPFIDLAWTCNAGDPAWVPPLRLNVATLLDRRKHPFHEHAEVAYFLAERGGRPVGRIAAIVNRAHNDFHGDRVGFWGFFECEDRQETAGALFDAAAAWLRARGRDTMRGPVSFSTNEECGLLIDGFDTPPTLMMAHNPRYYPRLVEGAGFAKAKDLLAYWLPTNQAPDSLRRGVERLQKREGIQIRGVDLKQFRREVELVQEIYNSAWERNWGFVPMTSAEIAHMAKEFRPVVDPDLVYFAYKDGEPIGFVLAVPDLNVVLKRIPDGRLLPFGIFKLLLGKGKVRTARLITLGLKPGHQTSGIGAALYLRVFEAGAAKGYRAAEGSWILEDNAKMIQAMENLGAYVYKTYRIYDRPL